MPKELKIEDVPPLPYVPVRKGDGTGKPAIMMMFPNQQYPFTGVIFYYPEEDRHVQVQYREIAEWATSMPKEIKQKGG